MRSVDRIFILRELAWRWMGEYYDLISFPCINLMSYLCTVFIKLFVFYSHDSFFTMPIVILMTCSISTLLDLWNTESMNEYAIIDKIVYSFFFKQKEVAAPVTSKVSSLSYSSKRPLLEIIILWNYTITICITIDNAIINKLWKAPNPYFALQNSHGYMKEFLGNL